MRRTWIVLLAASCAGLVWNRSYPLLEPDEGRNAEVAREMARDGDYVLPHLDGLPYLDKPATYFAAVALGLRAFGSTEQAARIPSLLFTLAAAAVLWRLARRLAPGTEPIAAIALLTMPLVLAFSRTVIFDSALLFVETLTLAALWRALAGEPDSGTWAAFAWATMGLGAIVKGPVAIAVPLLVATGYGLAAGVSLRPLFRITSWPWLFATGLPWFLAASLRRPDFPRYAFVYETLERVGTRTHGRGGPLWYFVPVALAGSFPWCVPALAGAARAWRCRTARRTAQGRPALFLASWALVPLVFFSLSQSKLPGYYLPALPATALAAAMVMVRCGEGAGGAPRPRWPLIAGALLLLLGVSAVPVAGSLARHLPTELERQALPGFALDFGVVLALCGAAGLAGALRRDARVLAVALAFPVIAVPFAGGALLDAIGRGRSSKDLAAAIERAAPGAEVVGVAAWPTSLRFYLDRPVLLATATGAELTSNYVVSRVAELRDAPLGPLRPADWWRARLEACPERTVFVARVRTAGDSVLAARLPLIARGGADERFAAYGPCLPAPAGPRPR